MKIYKKPTITIESIGSKEAISLLEVSNGKVADFDAVPQDSWDSWVDLFK